MHAWRSRWLAGQLPYLDQFSTELPAFNMLLLMVCSFTFPSSHFWPTGFVPNLLSSATSGWWASPPAASGKVTASYLNPWLSEAYQPADNINCRLTPIISQPYTYAYSAARAPGAQPDRQNPLVAFINVYKSWGNVDKGDLTLKYYQVCDAGGGRIRSGSGPIRLPWPQLSVAAGQLPSHCPNWQISTCSFGQMSIR